METHHYAHACSTPFTNTLNHHHTTRSTLRAPSSSDLNAPSSTMDVDTQHADTAMCVIMPPSLFTPDAQYRCSPSAAATTSSTMPVRIDGSLVSTMYGCWCQVPLLLRHWAAANAISEMVKIRRVTMAIEFGSESQRGDLHNATEQQPQHAPMMHVTAVFLGLPVSPITLTQTDERYSRTVSEVNTVVERVLTSLGTASTTVHTNISTMSHGGVWHKYRPVGPVMVYASSNGFALSPHVVARWIESALNTDNAQGVQHVKEGLGFVRPLQFSSSTSTLVSDEEVDAMCEMIHHVHM